MANFASSDRAGINLTFSGMGTAIIKLIVLFVLTSQAGSSAFAAEDTEVLSPADKRLKQIQTEFESVDIDAKDYTEKRYAIFKTWVNEVIRLRGSRPFAALTLVEAQSHASTYADKLKAEMLKEDPNVFGGSGGAMPSKASDKPVTTTPKSRYADPKAKEKGDGADSGTKPANTTPPQLAALARGMRNFIKSNELKHAKEYAKEIIEKYPNTPEAVEAKTVIEKKD